MICAWLATSLTVVVGSVGGIQPHQVPVPWMGMDCLSGSSRPTWVELTRRVLSPAGAKLLSDKEGLPDVNHQP